MEPGPPAPTSPNDPDDRDDARVEEIMREGPVGAWALAGVSTFVVMAIYLLFYLLAYLPRGQVQ
ncbi:hypothetical protein PE066_02605 [Ramlibacter tataouinensis]|uniref:hypothetical protein n=1 Tax=Ramlibacter tataouinensis TaxID=94132 RepID=UPI0022F38B55|nr:hypothetical protein [Ramlibacter tataouinensis]WBY02446.1 hypothetical protein PE066_02605 [Ramlibacter tataouinensis]